MLKTKKIIYIIILTLFLLTGCNHKDDYDKNIKPSEIRESQTTNEIALTNLNLGIAYLKEGDYNKALEKLKKSLSADSDYAPTYNVLGLLYQLLGDNNKAEENFKRALAINNIDSSTLNNYGNFLCQQGRLEEAERSFLRAAENPLYEAPEIAITNAGQCLYVNNQIEKSKKYFRQALQLNPRIPQALLKMSEMNFEEKNYLSARAYLQRYQENIPHNAKTLLLGIQIEKKLGDNDAVSSYELLLKNSFPDSDELASLEKNDIAVASESDEKRNSTVSNKTIEVLPNKEKEVFNEIAPQEKNIKLTNELVNASDVSVVEDHSEKTRPKLADEYAEMLEKKSHICQKEMNYSAKDISQKRIMNDLSKSAIDEQTIMASVYRWENAWSAQDVENYFFSYAEDFIAPKGLKRKKWESERSKRIRTPKFIKITLSDIKIDMRGEDYAKVSFVQNYKSDTYNDVTKKDLLMNKKELNFPVINGVVYTDSFWPRECGSMIKSIRHTPIIYWQIVEERVAENGMNTLEEEKVIVSSTSKQFIIDSVNQWANAWSEQDVDKYLAAYANEFIPTKGLTKKRWEKIRIERLLAPGFIKITLSNLKISMRGENYAKVNFMQTYQSDSYKDRIKKELLLEKINGEWLIIKEK